MKLLVKFLDSKYELALQAHPTTERAREKFNSDSGKTECWYIVDTRKDTDEPAYVLAGFKEGITRGKFEELFEQEDIEAMIKCCHKIPVQKDEMYFIPGGFAHAIGAGCFILEIQEPSDLIVKVFKNHEFAEGEEAWKELQIGTYIYEGMNYDNNLSKCQVLRKIRYEDENGCEEILIGNEQTSCFGGLRYIVKGTLNVYCDDFCSTNIVISGNGIIRYRGGEMNVKKADEIFLPAALRDLQFINDVDETPLVIIRAVPPSVI